MIRSGEWSHHDRLPLLIMVVEQAWTHHNRKAGMTATEMRATPTTALAPMTHRQVLEAMSGLVLALFVAILSSTVVTTALPTIISDLHGTQDQYTWVITITLLVSTASTPVWGKLSDLMDKKVLMQIGIVIFALGSVLSGLSQSTEQLIAFRAVQGLGLGGLLAMTQVVLAAMISPRERGRYSGYLGAAFAVGTVSGPLIGGLIVDTSWLGWRWCFYVGVPFAAAALVLLQKTLRLPHIRRRVSIDYFGATFLIAGVSLLLVWATLAGKNFGWLSLESTSYVAGGLLLLALAVFAETRAAEPVIPLRLFADRTTSLAVIASLGAGIVLFGSTVFLSQYFQLARGFSPTKAGLCSLPLVLGLAVASTVSGQLISRYGRWKRYLVAGMTLLTAGLTLLALVDATIPLWQLWLSMAVVGLGIGMTLQNLILSVQNSVAAADLGAASATVTFFRSLGGAIGVSVLGSVLSHHVMTSVTAGLVGSNVPAGAAAAASSGQLTNLATANPVLRTLIETAYGDATGLIFAISAPVALICLIAVLFIREVPLRTTTGLQSVTEHSAT